MSITNINSVTTELVTILTVCVVIDGKDILLDNFRNEDIAKGVLISGLMLNLEVFMLLMRLHF